MTKKLGKIFCNIAVFIRSISIILNDIRIVNNALTSYINIIKIWQRKLNLIFKIYLILENSHIKHIYTFHMYIHYTDIYTYHNV